MDCFLCEIPRQPDRAWYDTVLARNASAFVVPAVGSLAMGHVLVSPYQHKNAVQQLPAEQREDFTVLLKQACAKILKVTPEVTVFEHSAPASPVERRSACTDHAHTHVVPGAYNLAGAAQLAEPKTYNSLEKFYLRTKPYDGYIMMGLADVHGHSKAIMARDVGQPQYLRQKLFELAGWQEEWDYALYPNESAMKATINLFENPPV